MHHLSELASPLRSIGQAISRPRKASAVSLDWELETSPTILLGRGCESLPSFWSGTISTTVKEPAAEIIGFYAVLKAHTIQKKPARNRCAECKYQYFEIQHWSFLSQDTVLQNGTHTFPFSTLVPDHLPASMKSALLSISYEFHAEVHFKSPGTPKHTPQSTTFDRILTIRRHISIPTFPLQATRSLPVTGIQVESSINSIIRSTGVNKTSLSLSGLLSSSVNGQEDYIWRLWQGSWRLEEKMEAIAIPCDRHRCSTPEHKKKDLLRRKIRNLGQGVIHNTWEEREAEGTAQVDFKFSIRPHSINSERNYSYDTKNLDGTEVIHMLVVDLVLVKESFPHGKPHSSIRTGVAKILTLPYRVFLVDDQSTGPSWIVESSPAYQDKGSSPPGYWDGEDIAKLENSGSNAA
ncbi:hypothetical protein F5X68DRAFT_142218 [Plectosphaerella plurivora]|uniref:LDB19 N-terminal domain-containing protein n=1 Tax=Plectosphaerella plurivora TaxID=936078 RepID=A0A9P9A791_9PEZI|nr:hypothetical protein F5X68DRAFT_142218 [Plectosphaerella plurivora]